MNRLTFHISMLLEMYNKENLREIIGIHPTCSENFTTLSVTKSLNKDSSADGC